MDEKVCFAVLTSGYSSNNIIFVIIREPVNRISGCFSKTEKRLTGFLIILACAR
jgi:hypothetical protein